MDDNKKNNKKRIIIWIIVLLLLAAVAITTVVISKKLNGYQEDDKGAIDLTDEDGDNDPSGSENSGDEDGDEDTDKEPSGGPSADPSEEPSAEPELVPGFMAYDDKTVWTTNTAVDIFSISYGEGGETVTVKSDDGAKVIAPGTEQSYTFKLKNTGEIPLDYCVTVNAYFTPAEIEIPITGRIVRYDGKWVAGDAESFDSVPELNGSKDYSALGVGKYTYYTLEWVWPFESGDDELDTLLGDMAAAQELTFTIEINTYAEESTDPGYIGGLTPPQTGDNANILLWILIAAGAAGILFFLLGYMKKQREDGDEEDEISDDESDNTDGMDNDESKQDDPEERL